MDNVNNPAHYGGEDNPFETIKVITNWMLNFNMGNAIKYLSRAGKKNDKILEDHEKAYWYLEYEYQQRLLDIDIITYSREDELRDYMTVRSVLKAWDLDAIYLPVMVAFHPHADRYDIVIARAQLQSIINQLKSEA